MSGKTSMPKSFGKLSDFFVEKLSPLLDARVIQVLALRQTHDFTVLRTEESRELNTVVIPESIESTRPTMKVAFLASKQKAVENRMFSRLLRTAHNYDCHLKDQLCMKCPRCALFGAVSVRGGQDYNIRHRVEYSTAYSLEPYDDLLETLTFNAVEEDSQLTGQALGITHNVRPLANFPSVISLTSVTWQELALYLKTLLASKSYGAESRIKGDVRNTVFGIVGGYEEIVTSLEYSLELAVKRESDLSETTQELLKKYASLSASRSNVVVLTAEETKALVSEVQDMKLDEAFVTEMQEQVDQFVKTAKQKPE